MEFFSCFYVQIPRTSVQHLRLPFDRGRTSQNTVDKHRILWYSYSISAVHARTRTYHIRQSVWYHSLVSSFLRRPGSRLPAPSASLITSFRKTSTCRSKYTNTHCDVRITVLCASLTMHYQHWMPLVLYHATFLITPIHLYVIAIELAGTWRITGCPCSRDGQGRWSQKGKVRSYRISIFSRAGML